MNLLKGIYLLTFINDILQINKIEANKVELDPEIFNLKTKVENVVAALNNSAMDNNIMMHIEYDKKLPEIFDGDQLKIYESIRTMVKSDVSNFEYVEGNEFNILKELLNNPMPYNGNSIKEAKTAQDELTSKVLARILEEKTKAISATQKAIDDIIKDPFKAQKDKLKKLKDKLKKREKKTKEEMIARLFDIQNGKIVPTEHKV